MSDDTPPAAEPEAPPPKLIDRIKKLLALANSSNVNEAASAAAKAAELMGEHKLSEADVSANTDDGSTLVDLPLGAEGFLASWKFALVAHVARAFFCEAIALRHMRRRKVRIVGRRNDAEVASHVFDHFVKEIERLASAESSDPFYVVGKTTGSMDTREYLDHFRRGAAAGIADKLKLVTAQFRRKSEKAMVVARSSRDELRGYMKSKFGDSKVVEKTAIGADVANQMAYARGYEKGVDLSVPGRDGGQSLPGDVAVPPSEPPPSPPRASASPFSSFRDDLSDDLSGMSVEEIKGGIESLQRALDERLRKQVPEERLRDPLHYDEDEENDLSRGRGGRSLWDPFGDNES
jgi:hypothetical protein